MKRRRLTNRKSKKLFTKTAQRVHPKNVTRNTNPMRGGIRL